MFTLYESNWTQKLVKVKQQAGVCPVVSISTAELMRALHFRFNHNIELRLRMFVITLLLALGYGHTSPFMVSALFVVINGICISCLRRSNILFNYVGCKFIWLRVGKDIKGFIEMC